MKFIVATLAFAVTFLLREGSGTCVHDLETFNKYQEPNAECCPGLRRSDRTKSVRKSSYHAGESPYESVYWETSCCKDALCRPTKPHCVGENKPFNKNWDLGARCCGGHVAKDRTVQGTETYYVGRTQFERTVRKYKDTICVEKERRLRGELGVRALPRFMEDEDDFEDESVVY